MRRTGIFFHYQQGERLRDFPQALDGIVEQDNVFLYDAHYPFKPPSDYDLVPLPTDVLCQVHTNEMVEEIMRGGDFEGALLSVAGTVSAAIRIWRGELDNAFVFTGYGDHHAGSHFYGGGCYFNGAAVAIAELRRHFRAKRFAIVDTDAHHGDGTWELFKDDPEVLYVCLCPGPPLEQNNNVNVPLPWRLGDDAYLRLLETGFIERARAFRPEAIFWNWGYDGTQGDYGDLGLTPQVHVRMAQQLQETADAVCQGRLIAVLCGGSRRDLARSLIPPLVRVLAGQKQAGRGQ